MARRKDEFSEATRRKVAERACFICSKPDCRKMTMGPHSDPEKSMNLGIAGHIKAAQPGGPRYDKDQLEGERRGIGNAIWLCQEHGRAVDADTSKHTVEQLISWKQQHEAFVKTGTTVPLLQAIETLTRFKDDAGTVRLVFEQMNNAEVFWGDPFHETPYYVLDSLVRFRQELAAILASAEITSSLRSQLDALLDICRTFVRDSDLSSRRKVSDTAFENPDQFLGGIKFFRDAVHSQVEVLSKLTKVEIPQRLKRPEERVPKR